MFTLGGRGKISFNIIATYMYTIPFFPEAMDFLPPLIIHHNSTTVPVCVDGLLFDLSNVYLAIIFFAIVLFDMCHIAMFLPRDADLQSAVMSQYVVCLSDSL